MICKNISKFLKSESCSLSTYLGFIELLKANPDLTLHNTSCVFVEDIVISCQIVPMDGDR